MSRLQEIEKRLLEIRAEIDTDAADIPALEEEVDALQEERKGILSAAEKRKALIDKVTDGIEGAVVRTFEERGKATEKAVSYTHLFKVNRAVASLRYKFIIATTITCITCAFDICCKRICDKSCL